MHPDLLTTSVERSVPALTQSGIDLLRNNSAKKAPTKESPAPFVSRSSPSPRAGTGYSAIVTSPPFNDPVATTVGAGPLVKIAILGLEPTFSN